MCLGAHPGTRILVHLPESGGQYVMFVKCLNSMHKFPSIIVLNERF